jgi:hypothetical protein
MLKRWSAFTLFLNDGRVCLTNNVAERGLRGIALGRKSRLFCGSDRGGMRAAAMYSLIVTAGSQMFLRALQSIQFKDLMNFCHGTGDLNQQARLQ